MSVYRYDKVTVVLMVALALAGCSNRVTPPVALTEPVTVYILDHGRHPSLVVPDQDEGWVRYVHGEWRWYAEVETGLWRGMQALLWPTEATIGRRELDSVPEARVRSPLVPEGFVAAYALDVERSRVAELRQRLDHYFDDPEKEHYQSRYNLYFVPYPHSYWLFRHSNRKMVEWLRELDVEVRGPGLWSEWHIDAPEENE